jgi:hypothetical protein
LIETARHLCKTELAEVHARLIRGSKISRLDANKEQAQLGGAEKSFPGCPRTAFEAVPAILTPGVSDQILDAPILNSAQDRIS